MSRWMTRRIGYLGTVGILVGALNGGCSTTMAEIQTSDHNVLVIKGYGTKSMISHRCLTAETIKHLISSQIPPGQTSSCYWVAMISSDSSDISRAVTSFIHAKQEFDDKLTTIATDKKLTATELTRSAPDKAYAIEVATAFLLGSATEPAATLVEQAKSLPTEQRVPVKEQLAKLRANIVEPKIQQKLDAVLAVL